MSLPYTGDRPLHILLVKTSSLGDILHNLPVVTDIIRHYPETQIDWLVEESFVALPRLHAAIKDVIPVALRRWRAKPLSPATWRQIRTFRTLLTTQHYDFVIDTQGLIKSALLMIGANGLRCGFDKHSAREPIASFFYQKTFAVAKEQHAVERNRQLAAHVLGYALDMPADYGIQPPSFEHFNWLGQDAYAVLLHSTSRSDKLWSEANWISLGRYLNGKNIRSVLPWGNETERFRSLRLSELIPGSIVPNRLGLNDAAALLGGAHAVIGVDTGLAHLAAALNIPTVGIYTATDPALTGLYGGSNIVNLGGTNNPPDSGTVIAALQQILNH